MKRSDFFKALAGLAIAPLAVKELAGQEKQVPIVDLRDVAYRNGHGISSPAPEEFKKYLFEYDNTGMVFIGDIYNIPPWGLFMITSFRNHTVGLTNIHDNPPNQIEVSVEWIKQLQRARNTHNINY